MYDFVGLYDALKKGLTDLASSRTVKYVIDDKQQLMTLHKICYTAQEIMRVFRINGKITVKGECYEISDYSFPKHMVEIISCGKIYATKDAIGTANPWYRYIDAESINGNHVPNPMDTEEIVDVEGKPVPDNRIVLNNDDILTPDEVAAFFRRFNENQNKDANTMLVLVPCSLDQYYSLDDFKGLLTKDGFSRFIRGNDSGILDENVAYFAGIRTPFDDKYVVTYPISNVEVLGKWLVS